MRLDLEREPAEPTSMSSAHELAIAGDSGPLLDARAKEAYRRRLAEIEEDIADATSMADLARIAQAKAEREFLVRELSRAVGLGGRDRFRVRASPCERHARRAPGTRSHS
jgi:hypothetical protein